MEQPWNPKPRIFRLEDDGALINRLGFNNDGIDIIKNRIQTEKKKGILGINIGTNKNTKDQKNDFCLGLKNFLPKHKNNNTCKLQLISKSYVSTDSCELLTPVISG